MSEFINIYDVTQLNNPLVSKEEEIAIKQFYSKNPLLQNKESPEELKILISKNRFEFGSEEFNPEEAWIQTFSGKRFTPINPNSEAIVIQDIAHSLSMQCRFGGHSYFFYSVAQHSVLVSYLCNDENSLYGLLHDASEAYISDICSPLKKTKEFDSYRVVEKKLQDCIYKRFGLNEDEPKDVKKADVLMLSTEARDLLINLRSDWIPPIKPLPLKIDPLLPKEAEKLFLDRFYELI